MEDGEILQPILLVFKADGFKLPVFWLPVEIVHGVAGVTGNLVQALTSAHRLFYSILIVHDFVIYKVMKNIYINKYIILR